MHEEIQASTLSYDTPLFSETTSVSSVEATILSWGERYLEFFLFHRRLRAQYSSFRRSLPTDSTVVSTSTALASMADARRVPVASKSWQRVGGPWKFLHTQQSLMPRLPSSCSFSSHCLSQTPSSVFACPALLTNHTLSITQACPPIPSYVLVLVSLSPLPRRWIAKTRRAFELDAVACRGLEYFFGVIVEVVVLDAVRGGGGKGEKVSAGADSREGSNWQRTRAL